MRLNLGCGDNSLPPPWKNHDDDIDITKKLPWPDNSAEFIVIEHCVEHITYYEAIDFFREAYRVLRIGGVLRVTVPSLTQIMNCQDQDYYTWLHSKGWAPTADDRGAMHAILYCHGHKTAWNAMLMEATLYFAGFNAPRKQETPGWSTHPALCNVEGHERVIGEKFNRIESITFEAAKMTGDLSKDYDANFYAMHVGWKDEYERMAQIVVDNIIDFESVLDLGCGNGYLIEALEKRHGKHACGIDGSEHVLKYNPSILIADITKTLTGVQPHDLIICTEVAEHIDARYTEVLVDNICGTALKYIFFSAARAGHGGHLHVNEQERGYWIEKFARRGFSFASEATARISVELQKNKKTWWFANNCFVLVRRPV
jgi:ubiquinone/menaquinone biosynthesis C-methylase UbiE